MPIQSMAPPSWRLPSSMPALHPQVSACLRSKGKSSSLKLNSVRLPKRVLSCGDPSVTSLIEVIKDTSTPCTLLAHQQHLFIFFLVGAIGVAGAVYWMVVRLWKQPEPVSGPSVVLCDTMMHKAHAWQDFINAPRIRELPLLPKWWPASVSLVPGKEYLEEHKKLQQSLTDMLNNMQVLNFKESDIITFRRKCRIFGLSVTFPTDHTRDSFYHFAVDMVINYCSRITETSTTVLVDDEEARQFLCELSHNIQLGNARAVCLVRAAIAARTRKHFLESFAFEAEGKTSQARNELLKIIQIYTLFPPAEDSPEIWMSSDLMKHQLDSSQRELLLNMFKSISRPELHSIATTALGLNLLPGGHHSPNFQKSSSNTRGTADAVKDSKSSSNTRGTAAVVKDSKSSSNTTGTVNSAKDIN